MATVPKVCDVRGGGKVLRNGEWITVLRVGSADVISKVIMIETILPGGGGAPSGGREGEASVILGNGGGIGGGAGIGIRVVADGLLMSVDRRLMVWVINYAGIVQEFSITSGIVGIRGVRVGRGVEGVCGKGEIGLRGDNGRSGGAVVVDWGATETG